MRRVKHARTVSLTVVLACVVGTMAVGTALKTPCAGGNYDGRQYRLLCYSDIVPLLGTEQLGHGRLPFLDRCAETGNNCDEYPVLTMYLMRTAAWISGDHYGSFYYVNAILLTVFAAGTAVGLWMLAGRRALWFALAPTLLIYGTINWDLFAVMLMVLALVAFAERRDGWAGVFLGLGAAAKFFPALLLLPLFLQGLQDREPDRSVRVLWWTAGSWAVVNLPFAVAAPSAWWEFFRFNGERTPDFDSLWYIACRHSSAACISTGNVDALSLGLFFALFGALFLLKLRRDRDFPRWTLGFPLLVSFLLVNKVYSPQYGLWLLPWFALVVPGLRRFVAFEIADIAVFVTRFWFFGAFTGAMTWPQQWWFETAVLVRTLVLIWCLIGWVRDDAPVRALGTRGWGRVRPSADEAVAAPA